MACQEAGIELSGKSVLLLGAGGTAAAIAVAFGDAGVGELHIANRSVERAAHLRDKLHGTGMKGLAVHHLDALPDAEIVINTTPLGMKEGDPMPSATRLRAGRQGVLRRGLPSRDRRHRSSGWPASGVSPSSPATGCCSTRVYWRRSSGPDVSRT